jgi:hypothetical protein
MTPDQHHCSDVERSRGADGTGREEGLTHNRPVVAVVRPAPGTSIEEAERIMAHLAESAARERTLLAELAGLYGSGPPDLRKTLTVYALVQSLPPEADPKAIALVLELLPEGLPAKSYDDAMRGMIAAVPAILRAVDPSIENSGIEAWLAEENKKRGLDFEAGDVMRWFYDCKREKVTQATLEAFNFFRPAPSESLTEAYAKQWAASILGAAVSLKARPLVRTTPRRRN